MSCSLFITQVMFYFKKIKKVLECNIASTAQDKVKYIHKIFMIVIKDDTQRLRV